MSETQEPSSPDQAPPQQHTSSTHHQPEALTLHVQTLAGSHTMMLSPVTIESYQLFTRVMQNFGTMEPTGLRIHLVQRATSDLKENLSSFTNEYGTTFPTLKRLNAFIQRIPENEWLMLLDERPTDTLHQLHINFYLNARNQHEDEDEALLSYKAAIEEHESIFGGILNEYNLSVLEGSQREIIGAKLKSDRKCRFCGGRFSNGVKFKEKAHAISESLGNKGLVLGDECDDCNTFFGEKIEPHLIEHLNIHRAFLGIKGKQGMPELTYSNATVKYIDGVMTIVASEAGTMVESNGNLRILLKSTFDFVPINMYKALCKIALSTIGDEELPYVANTIKWLRHNEFPETRVPLVAKSVVHHGFCRTPQIANYVRKSDNKDYPHIISEFRLGSWLYVFVIPLSQKDTKNFLESNDFEKFFDIFMHYKSANWEFENLNSTKPLKLSTTINVTSLNETKEQPAQ
jgi:hypothetical protein